MKNIFQLILTGLVVMTLANCGGGGGGSISIGTTSDSFDDGNLDFNPRMDILWVVDPSKSMFEEVEKVRNNISSFIEGFIALGYDYRMGVITTSAWSDYAYRDPVLGGSNLEFLVQGTPPDEVPVFASLHKGQCVNKILANQPSQTDFLSADTETSVGTFLSKFSTYFDVYGITLGTSGCGLVGPPFGSYQSVSNNFFADPDFSTVNRQRLGAYINDERPLQSVMAFLERDIAKDPADRFVREGAHLAIIIVSDEVDASRDSLVPEPTFVIGAPGNHTSQDYLTDLDDYKDGRQNYSIYTIADLAQSNNIARDIATPSGGLSFDINATQEQYVSNLNQISNAILTASSFFPLAYTPLNPNNIEIIITKPDGTQITLDSSEYTYIASQQGVVINAASLPAKDDLLNINYIPSTLIGGQSEAPRLQIDNVTVRENLENEPIGTVVSVFADPNKTGGVFSIEPPVAGFAIDPATGVLSTTVDTFDADVAPVSYDVNVQLTYDDSTFLEREFKIRIVDAPDLRPIAINSSFAISENSAQADGVIRFSGNVRFNDIQIDSSEPHTWLINEAISQDPTGVPSVTADLDFSDGDGSFDFEVDTAALALDASDIATYTFTYDIQGTLDGEVADTSSANRTLTPATVTIDIIGANQGPVILAGGIPDQEVEFSSAGIVKIPLEVSDISVSGTADGAVGDLVDNSPAAGFESAAAAAQAHFIQIDFPVTAGIPQSYEVDRFEITGNQSLGNSILQVLAPNNSVLTREVLPVSVGNTFTVDMDQKVIGRGIKMIRPSGARNSERHENLRINEIEVYGTLAVGFDIDLYQYFDDADRVNGDKLTFFATDAFGEGPAPGWLTIEQDASSADPLDHTAVLTGIPPAGADVNIGIVAQDISGAAEFTIFNIRRVGVGSGALNGPPIAFLPLDDEKRGGITMKRYGGGSGNNNPLLDNQIVHGEIDNFIINPLDGEIIADALVNYDSGSISTLAPNTYKENPSAIPAGLRALIPEEQHIHFGDNYGRENGWSITPVFSDLKYPTQAALDYCVGDNDNPSLESRPGGTINPCTNTIRSYGETYTGYFVPAETGIYRFKSRKVDDTVRLLMAPTEYTEDLIPVMIANYNAGTFSSTCTGMNCMANSLAPGIQNGGNSEFVSPGGADNGAGQGSPTQIFYEGTTQSYKDGYVLLKQGNVYAMEIRFGEGGGVVDFEFEYDRKDQSCDPVTNSPTSSCWDGFTALDAAVLVPREGTDAHSPQVIPALSGVNLDVSDLFYDAEQDALEYSARLVNPDGTAFVGPGGTSDVSEIGLDLNALTGLMVGSLNAAYTGAAIKPRVVFTATERFTAAQAATSSLPIKFDAN